jgi:hypothetical protein
MSQGVGRVRVASAVRLAEAMWLGDRGADRPRAEHVGSMRLTSATEEPMRQGAVLPRARRRNLPAHVDDDALHTIQCPQCLQGGGAIRQKACRLLDLGRHVAAISVANREVNVDNPSWRSSPRSRAFLVPMDSLNAKGAVRMECRNLSCGPETRSTVGISVRQLNTRAPKHVLGHLPGEHERGN